MLYMYESRFPGKPLGELDGPWKYHQDENFSNRNKINCDLSTSGAQNSVTNNMAVSALLTSFRIIVIKQSKVLDSPKP